MSDTAAVSPSRFCGACGTPVTGLGRFCMKCGRPMPPPEQAAVATQPVTVAPPTSDPVPQPQPNAQSGFQVTLVDAGPYRGRVILALRQLLQLDGPTAGRFTAAAPAVLAVGLTREQSERLRTALVGAGANVRVEGPPEPAADTPAAAPTTPKPEPARTLAEGVIAVRQRTVRRGSFAVTGLALGRGGTYLSYGRAEGSRLVSPPDFIRMDARSMIPTAVRLAAGGAAELYGTRALNSWVRESDGISLGFTEELGFDDGAALPPLRAFLKFLDDRLLDVLGPAAADAREGAATSVAICCERPDAASRQLADLATQAGFPVVQLVPEPLAAVASYLAPAGERPAAPQYFLVVDWGSQGLDLSVVEDSPQLDGPMVIDHIEYPLGGIWFDMILEGWLADRLPGELTDEDRRALTLFARLFKENASASFADGRAEHVQYCVLPAGLPPTRISIGKAELDTLFDDARTQFEKAVADAPGRIGFEAAHFDQVIMVGGAARSYFARDSVRKALGRNPMVSPNPEEAIARGLVFWGARS